MKEFLLFMVFSTIEGVSAFALTLYIYRLDLKRYILPVLIVVTLANLQSYAIREDTSLSFIAPATNIIFIILFMATIVRVPIIWAMITGVSGFFAFGLLQVSIVLASNGYLSIDAVQHVPLRGYMLQTLTGISGTYIGWMLYQFGYGFSFEFDRLRLRFEKTLVIGFIGVMLSLLTLLIYYKDAFMIMLSFLVSMLLFLYYAINKEAAS
ncbi:hypothetical protein [Paenibacillus sp. OV219]|uniref:hypothetical protein n=1 Tax=Paenibacillus sp. OV219 TaxID=1884377 RepID=UPI0008CA058C|nr:hypothetical protein [Paenibacillus sp. OV219]SEM66011.1 hypothetical protein SAMN05518847_101450 [Paenibacillus sp. OV219]